MHFKKGKEWVDLDTEGYTLYKPDDYTDWPEIESTVHPFAMIWKAVSEFGLGKSYDRLLCESHTILMMSAQQIYTRWMKYAEDNPHLWSPEHPNRGPSPPSNHGSRHPSNPSQSKRRRSDDDGDADDDDRPSKRSGRSGSARDAPDIVDEIPSMVSYSENDRTQSSPNLQSPSLVDRPVRVAANEEEDSDDEDDDHRPAALQPKRKFNISDWAKTASAEGEPVVEVECPSEPGVSEEPRKPPRGTWKRWRPAYHV